MRFWDNHTIDDLSVGWRLSYDPILCRARTKTVSSHDDGVIHGLHAASPSPSGTTRRTTTTTTDRAKQPSRPETHSVLSEFAANARSSYFSKSLQEKDIFLSTFSSAANARMVLMRTETFVRELIVAIMHYWCPGSDFHRQELHILIAIVRLHPSTLRVLKQCISS